jgi:hypothetical protein
MTAQFVTLQVIRALALWFGACCLITSYAKTVVRFWCPQLYFGWFLVEGLGTLIITVCQESYMLYV